VLDVQRYLPSSVYAANYGNFEDPEEIDLYDKMLRETDPAKQRSLITIPSCHEIILRTVVSGRSRPIWSS
jgi:hypothetical protein